MNETEGPDRHDGQQPSDPDQYSGGAPLFVLRHTAEVRGTHAGGPKSSKPGSLSNVSSIKPLALLGSIGSMGKRLMTGSSTNGTSSNSNTSGGSGGDYPLIVLECRTASAHLGRAILLTSSHTLVLLDRGVVLEIPWAQKMGSSGGTILGASAAPSEVTCVDLAPELGHMVVGCASDRSLVILELPRTSLLSAGKRAATHAYAKGTFGRSFAGMTDVCWWQTFDGRNIGITINDRGMVIMMDLETMKDVGISIETGLSGLCYVHVVYSVPTTVERRLLCYSNEGQAVHIVLERKGSADKGSAAAADRVVLSPVLPTTPEPLTSTATTGGAGATANDLPGAFSVLTENIDSMRLICEVK